MRWGLFTVLALLLLSALSLSAFSASPGWGCCVTNTSAGCFDGSAVNYQGGFDAFVQKCQQAKMQDVTLDQVSRELNGPPASCVPLRSVGQTCEIGCCCKDALSPKSGEQTTKGYCTTLNASDPINDPRSFKSLQTGKTCDQICSGSTTSVTPTATYPVRGTVVHRGTPETPLIGITVAATSLASANKAVSGAGGAFTLPQRVGGPTTFVAANLTPGSSCRVVSVSPTQPVDVQREITNLKIVMDCSPATSCTTNPLPTVSGFSVVQGANTIKFTIAINDAACGTFNDFEVTRYIKRGTTIDLSTRQVFYTESGRRSVDITDPVPEDVVVCYAVRATFQRGDPTEPSGEFSSRNLKCTPTGSSRCTSGISDPWCGTNDRGAPVIKACDDANQVITLKPCASSEICVPTESGAQCIKETSCQSCNGLLGLFSKLPLSIPYAGATKTCTELASITPSGARCYKDEGFASGKRAIIPVYNACAAVTDCSAYASAAACQRNTCEVKNATGDIERCRWVTTSPELGLGICTGATTPACETCSKFGECTREVCQSIDPGCYFDTEPNGLSEELFPEGFPRCVSPDKMACRYYDTKADCIGAGANAMFNVQYSGRSRTGGDHARTTSSADKQRLSVCSWVEATAETPGLCIKNADQSPGATEDDCMGTTFERDPACVQDRTPPVTTLHLRSSRQYGKHELRTIPFSATDDKTSAAAIKTRVCFAKGASCYPTQAIGAISLTGITEGDYTMSYYSEDANGNLERVRSEQIRIVDLGYATLENIEITQNTD